MTAMTTLPRVDSAARTRSRSPLLPVVSQITGLVRRFTHSHAYEKRTKSSIASRGAVDCSVITLGLMSLCCSFLILSSCGLAHCAGSLAIGLRCEVGAKVLLLIPSSLAAG